MSLARVTEAHLPWWGLLILAALVVVLGMCVIAGGDSDDAPTPDGYRDRSDLLP